MTQPIIVCPNCATEIKLTESLAAPLIAATRKDFERKLAAKESDIAKREAVIARQQQAIAEAQGTIDAQVAGKLATERMRIASRGSRQGQACRRRGHRCQGTRNLPN